MFLHCWGDGKFQLYHVATATYQRLVQGNEDRPMIYHLRGPFFFRKRAAQFDPGAEKFPGTRRESQLSGSTHLGWLLLWQLCLSTRGRRASVTTPTDAGWMTNQQFSVTCETVAVKVEVRRITKVLFFCCFFWVLLVNLSVSDWITFNWINYLCQPFFWYPAPVAEKQRTPLPTTTSLEDTSVAQLIGAQSVGR